MARELGDLIAHCPQMALDDLAVPREGWVGSRIGKHCVADVHDERHFLGQAMARLDDRNGLPGGLIRLPATKETTHRTTRPTNGFAGFRRDICLDVPFY